MVTMYFAHLEHVLDEVLAIATVTHKWPALTGKRKPFGRRRNHLRDFHRNCVGPDHEKEILDQFLKGCRHCSLERNKFAHDLIVSNLKRKTIDLISRQEKIEVKQISSAEVYKVAQNILHITHVGKYAKIAITRHLSPTD